MGNRTAKAIILTGVIFAATGTWVLAAAQKSSGQNVARGKYLVEEVAKCTECHTPRDKNNQLIRGQWLQGAPIWIQPVVKTANWADSAPKLAGLPNYTDEQVMRVLTAGVNAEGKPIQPPMHIYHMNKADAAAIVAYLRSLSAAAPTQQ